MSNVQHEVDLQTAKALLELHETLNIPAPELPTDNILENFDNAEIMQ